MLTYQYIPHIITGVFILLMAGLFIYTIRIILNETKEERQFQRQLRFSLNPDLNEQDKESWLSRNLRILPELLIKSDIVDKGSNVDDVQRRLILILALVFTAFSFFARNPMAGAFPVIMIYGGLLLFAKYKINRIKNIMEEQIPGFVSSFKANIQANQHSQNAMIRAIDNTASPLYDELAYAKAIMEAGDFKPGIIALRRSTENDTLRQLASCIELAATSGSNIEKQIETIEAIIEDKQAIERKKKLGVNENKPLFIVASLFIPISFLGSYVMSDMHREYWFKTPMSWAILVGVSVVMIISSFATWKVIQKVEIG